jgi:uroporphyrinogen decarboxylase
VLKALNHEEPDRVAVDLGTTNVTTITLGAYNRLKDYLGINQESKIEIVDRAQQLVKPEEKILRLLEIDTRSVWLKRPKNWEMDSREDDSYVDEWGVTRRRVRGSWYFDSVIFPLKKSNIDDLRRYPWPDPDDLERFKGLKKEAEKLYRENRYPIVVDPTGSIPFGNAQNLRGFDVFLMDLMLNQKSAEALMDILLDFQVPLLKNLFKEIGSYIDVIKVADDLGTQSGPMISPKLYRKLIKPRHRQLISFIKENTKAKVLFHTDGGIYPFIEDLIEIGVDILNPIQVSAPDMDPDRLKKEFGNQLCFWGGIDTQKILPHGTVKDVKGEVKRITDILAPGGGYILASVHNLQPDVPPENICTMYKSAREH